MEGREKNIYSDDAWKIYVARGGSITVHLKHRRDWTRDLRPARVTGIKRNVRKTAEDFVSFLQ